MGFFKYCLHHCFECCFITVRKFWKYRFTTVGEFLYVFDYCFAYCWDRVENYWGFLPAWIRTRGWLSAACNVESSERCSIVCIIACVRDCVQCSSFFHHDTRLLRCSSLLEWTNFNLVLPGTVRFWQWQKWYWGLCFFGNNFNLRGCAGVVATGGTRRSHNCIHVKSILLLADSNYITWAPSIPFVSCNDLLCRDWVFCKHVRQKQKKLQNYHSQSPSWHGCQRLWHSSTESEKRGACVLFRQATGPSPTWSRVGLLRRLFSPEGKHGLKAAPTLKFYIRRIEKAFCLPSGRYFSRNKKVFFGR